MLELGQRTLVYDILQNDQKTCSYFKKLNISKYIFLSYSKSFYTYMTKNKKWALSNLNQIKIRAPTFISINVRRENFYVMKKKFIYHFLIHFEIKACFLRSYFNLYIFILKK